MNIPIEFHVIVLCLLAQAFLAGIELGVISINRHRLLHLVRTGSARAKIIQNYLHDTPRLFGTTLVGTCITLVTISTLAASLAERQFGETGQAAVAGVVSLIILVFGEYLPKVWFNRRPIDRCLPCANVLRLFERLLYPLVRLVIFVTEWASPQNRQEKQSLFVTREHIQTLVQDSAVGGQTSGLDRLMINRVLDLQMKSAAEIMTPIKQVTHAHDDATLQASYELARQSGHLRLPVLSADDGTCVGVLHLLGIIATIDNPDAVLVRDCMTPPLMVLPDVRADDLLPLMRRHRQPMAVVHDQTGHVLGLVTQENIVAFLMGSLSVKN